jgi:polygalacturonase
MRLNKIRTHLVVAALAAGLYGTHAARAMDEFKVAPPEIPNRTFRLLDFGAVGDGKTINTEAFSKAIAAVTAAGGGQLIVPKGEFLTGPIVLSSHMDLHLEEGAKIQFPTDWATYALALPPAAATVPAAPAAVPEGAPAAPAAAGAATGPAAAGRGRGARGMGGAGRDRGPGFGGVPALIYGNNVTDVAVTGMGTIDGGGWLFWGDTVLQREAAAARGGRAGAAAGVAARPPTAGRAAAAGGVSQEAADAARQRVGRPRIFVVLDGKRVKLQGVLLTNSPGFHVAPTRCEDLLIDGVRIKSPYDSPNTDALDPTSCNRVIIRNCVLDAGDDNVAIKTVVGYPSFPMQNVLIEGCTCLHGHGISMGSETYGGIQHVLVRNCSFDGGDQAIRIKSARDRGNILGDFTFSNIQMRNMQKISISINLFYQNAAAQRERATEPVTSSTPHLSGVHIDHVTGINCNKACDIVGLPESPVEDVTLSDVSVEANTGAVIQDVKRLVFKNVSFKVKTGDPLTVNHAEDSQLTLTP